MPLLQHSFRRCCCHRSALLLLLSCFVVAVAFLVVIPAGDLLLQPTTNHEIPFWAIRSTHSSLVAQSAQIAAYTPGMYYKMELTMAELPFRMRPAQPLTNKEVERLSASQEALHIEREPEGDLMVRTVGGMRAGGVSVDVMTVLHHWNDKTDKGHLLTNVGCYLPDGSMRGSYSSWVSNEKWNNLGADKRGFLPFCPELVVEVFSAMKFPDLAELQRRMQNW